MKRYFFKRNKVLYAALTDSYRSILKELNIFNKKLEMKTRISCFYFHHLCNQVICVLYNYNKLCNYNNIETPLWSRHQCRAFNIVDILWNPYRGIENLQHWIGNLFTHFIYSHWSYVITSMIKIFKKHHFVSNIVHTAMATLKEK